MSSYHRILSVFERSVLDKSMECNCDVHPWEILINKERWAGKIRLIGFVDVFFLICYSSDMRFEHGIIIYKDDDDIKRTLDSANVKPQDIALDIINKEEAQKDEKIPEKYFQFAATSTDYTITSLGHDISLKVKYPRSSLRKYEIKLLKNKNIMMNKRIKRGVNQHSLTDLMEDAIRLGVVTHAEVTVQLMGQFFAGTGIDDAMKKSMEAFTGANRADNVALSNER